MSAKYDRYQVARDRINSGMEAFYAAICALSVGDVDPSVRAEALSEAALIRDRLVRGVSRREQEAIRDEVLARLSEREREAMKAVMRTC